AGWPVPQKLSVIRSAEEEKQSPPKRLPDFRKRHERESGQMLKRLQQAVIDDANVVAVLMDAVRCCSLGQITHALFEVGGQYRRNMQGDRRRKFRLSSVRSHTNCRDRAS